MQMEPTESMIDYLTPAEYVSEQLELAGGKVSKTGIKMLENYLKIQTMTANNENVALLSKRTAAKSSSRKPENFSGPCRRCGKSGHKQATCRVHRCNF